LAAFLPAPASPSAGDSQTACAAPPTLSIAFARPHPARASETDPDEAEKFYRALASAKETVRIGMEASGHARRFERLVAELRFELWISDAAEIRTRRVRKQKTDRQENCAHCGQQLPEPSSRATQNPALVD
jgi:hypothetical protein